MLFVQPPSLLDRNPVQIHAVEHAIQRLDGPLQIGSIGLAERESLPAEQFPCLAGLGHSPLGQIDIGPSREPVLQIPLALSVTEQNNSFHNAFSFRIAVHDDYRKGMQ